jgi:hypothetical protein
MVLFGFFRIQLSLEGFAKRLSNMARNYDDERISREIRRVSSRKPMSSPRRARKVVLSPDLLIRDEITEVTVVSEDGFHHAAMETLQTEFRLARETGSPVQLLLFCHGDQQTYEAFLGDETMLQSEDADVRSIVGDNDSVALTLFEFL